MTACLFLGIIIGFVITSIIVLGLAIYAACNMGA